MKKIIFLPAILLALVCSCTSAPKLDQAASDQLDSLFSSLYPADGPGAAVLILRDGEPIYEKCWGFADMETKAPITGDTFFNIASMSKQFTAVALLQLVEQGKISLDDKVSKYFPQFTNPIWENITIANLLSHSSGIPDARGGYSREEKIQATDSLAIAFLDTLSFVNFAPGERYEYINPTFTLCGKLVSIVSGVEFADYVRENIFNPAGMAKALYYTPGCDSQIPNMAHGYAVDKETGEWKEDDFGEETFFATRPDGGIYTSVHEFAAWDKALCEKKVLKKETLDQAVAPHNMISENPRQDYGYGWIVERNEDGTTHCINHAGGNGGFRSYGCRYPASNTMFILFSNNNQHSWPDYKAEVERILGI